MVSTLKELHGRLSKMSLSHHIRHLRLRKNKLIYINRDIPILGMKTQKFIPAELTSQAD